MQSEIFRFAVVRPPHSNAAQTPEVIPFMLNAPEGQLLAALRKAQVQGDRKAMIKLCNDFVKGSHFLKNNTDINPKLLKFSAAIGLLPADNFRQTSGDLAKKILGTTPAEYVKGPVYLKSLSALTESIVAGCLSSKVSARNKAYHISIGRALYTLSLLAAKGSFGPRHIQTSTFVLPSGIFPLPLEGTNLEAHRKEQAEIRNKNAAERKKEIQRLSGNLEGFKSASNELLKAFDTSVLDKPAQGSAKHKGGFSLSAATTQKLSAATKTVLNQTGLSNTDVDVADAIANLERSMADTASELFSKADIATPLVRRGDNWFLGNDRDLVLVETGPVTSRVPGACPPLAIDTEDEPTPVVTNGRHDVRVIGIADLLIVEQDLLRYQYGEIAHIENVMKSELRDRKHRVSQLNEEIIITETRSSDLKSNDLTATERFELQTEAQKVINETSSMSMGASASASYGPFSASANFNYATSDSLTESQRVASDFARETISKTVTRIENRSLQRNVSRSVREVEETNQHTFDNKDGSEHITGIYRFIDKIYNAQIVNYGKRLMLEFVVPEPAAFLRHAFAKQPTEVYAQKPFEPGYCTSNGKKFNPLQVQDIDRVSYLYWASKYNVEGINPPPAQTVVVSRAITSTYKQTESVPEGDTRELISESNVSIDIPAGYRPLNADIMVDAVLAFADEEDDVSFVHVLIDRHNIKNNGLNQITFTPGVWKNVAVAVNTFNRINFSVVVNIFCRATPEAEEKWKLATFNLIMNAYRDQLSQYETALETERIRTGFTEIQGTNPLANRDTEKIELKRGCLSLLTGQQFESFDAMNRNVGANGYPEIDFDEAAEEGQFISFFEQAFEWNNMSYILYPYFWSNKDQWALLSQLKDNDPQFLNFLKAGSGRVSIPVRPGFESSIMNYLNTNTIWNAEGNLVIAEGDEPDQVHLAVVEELKSQLNNMNTPGIGLLNVTTNSNQVTGTDTNFTAEDVRKRILIAGKTYHIKEVITDTSIILAQVYSGPSERGIPYSFGAKLVGDPWEVKLPTNLVAIDDTLQVQH